MNNLMYKVIIALIIANLSIHVRGNEDDLDPKIESIVHASLNMNLFIDDERPIDTKTPFPDILAQQYFTRQKKQAAKKGKIFTEEQLLEQEKQYKMLVKYYEKQEVILKNLRNDPLISIFGGINYAMSLEEMKQEIKKKFDAMKKKGIIITSKQFKTIKDLYYMPRDYALKDLNRVWGADYLREKIQGSEKLRDKYDTPDYVIVVENIDAISITLYADTMFPLTRFMEDGSIYFKKIQGTPSGCEAEVGKEIGEKTVVDYTDICPGQPIDWINLPQSENVIKDTITGKYYIIDTGMDAFSIPLNETTTYALAYGATKFAYLNGIRVIYEGGRAKKAFINHAENFNEHNSIIYNFTLDKLSKEETQEIEKLLLQQNEVDEKKRKKEEANKLAQQVVTKFGGALYSIY